MSSCFLASQVLLLMFSQVVPDDNSCLFSSIALIFEQDITKAQRMRQSKLPDQGLRESFDLTLSVTVVADGIRTDMVTYNEAILGHVAFPRVEVILTDETQGSA